MCLALVLNHYQTQKCIAYQLHGIKICWAFLCVERHNYFCVRCLCDRGVNIRPVVDPRVCWYVIFVVIFASSGWNVRH